MTEAAWPARYLDRCLLPRRLVRKAASDITAWAKAGALLLAGLLSLPWWRLGTRGHPGPTPRGERVEIRWHATAHHLLGYDAASLAGPLQ